MRYDDGVYDGDLNRSDMWLEESLLNTELNTKILYIYSPGDGRVAERILLQLSVFVIQLTGRSMRERTSVSAHEIVEHRA